MTNKEKKQNLLTIEKELFGSYCEAVADLKGLRKEITEKDDKADAFVLNKIIHTIDICIDKHVGKIKNSGIWE